MGILLRWIKGLMVGSIKLYRRYFYINLIMFRIFFSKHYEMLKQLNKLKPAFQILEHKPLYILSWTAKIGISWSKNREKEVELFTKINSLLCRPIRIGISLIPIHEEMLHKPKCKFCTKISKYLWKMYGKFWLLLRIKINWLWLLLYWIQKRILLMRLFGQIFSSDLSCKFIYRFFGVFVD